MIIVPVSDRHYFVALSTLFSTPPSAFLSSREDTGVFLKRVEGLKYDCWKTKRSLSQNPQFCEKKTTHSMSKDFGETVFFSKSPRSQNQGETFLRVANEPLLKDLVLAVTLFPPIRVNVSEEFLFFNRCLHQLYCSRATWQVWGPRGFMLPIRRLTKSIIYG